MLAALSLFFKYSKRGGMFINSCFVHCQSESQDTWLASDSPRVHNKVGQCALSIAGFTQWTHVFEQAVLELIRGGKFAYSSNASSFSSLLFVTRANDIEALKKLVEKSEIDLDEQDGNGFSAAMIAATSGHVEAFRLLVYAGANVNLHNKHGETVFTLSESNKNSDVFEKVILEYALIKGSYNSAGFHALNRAACCGDIESVHMLTRAGYDVNVVDVDGYTPLMLAAKGGHGNACELLILNGAKCDIENARLETVLMLGRNNGVGNEAERVILDKLVRKLVFRLVRLLADLRRKVSLSKTIAEAVGDWYFGRRVTKEIDCAYPCDSTCHNLIG